MTKESEKSKPVSAADLDAAAAESQAAAATEGAAPETNAASEEPEAAASETEAPAGETQPETSAPSAVNLEVAPVEGKPLVGRKAKVLRGNAIYGEPCIIVDQFAGEQVRVKLTGPAFIANDPGVTLGAGEYEVAE